MALHICRKTQEQPITCYHTICSKKMKPQLKLIKTSKHFRSYSGHPLKVEGKAPLQVKYTKVSADIDFYVLHTDQKPLLSGNDREALKMIVRVNGVEGLRKFPKQQDSCQELTP